MQEQTTIQIPKEIEDRIADSANKYLEQCLAKGQSNGRHQGYLKGARSEYIASIQRERDAIMLFVEHLDTHYLQDTVNMDVWFDRVTGNPKTREQVYEIYLSLNMKNNNQ